MTQLFLLPLTKLLISVTLTAAIRKKVSKKFFDEKGVSHIADDNPSKVKCDTSLSCFNFKSGDICFGDW